jgi:uncharacterized membrane protein (UPF0127 family)
VGDSWTYRYRSIFDSSSHVIKVKVVGKGTLPDGERAKLWKYTYPNYTDTLWVTSNDTVAKIYYKPCLPCTPKMGALRLRYVLPLKVGNSWHTEAPYGDTTKVLVQKIITVPAGTFTTFEISKTLGYVTNSWTQDTLWFKNKVGLIKKSQWEYSLGPSYGDGIWKLKSYHVH